MTIQPLGSAIQSSCSDYIAKMSMACQRGKVTEMYSFDHDIGSFVARSELGRVSDDGLGDPLECRRQGRIEGRLALWGILTQNGTAAHMRSL